MVLRIRYAINGKVYTRFLAIDSVIRPSSQQLTDLILKLLKTELKWEPPNTVLGITVVDDVLNEEDSNFQEGKSPVSIKILSLN